MELKKLNKIGLTDFCYDCGVAGLGFIVLSMPRLKRFGRIEGPTLNIKKKLDLVHFLVKCCL